MASPSKRLAANAAGDFFVDSTCIDCAACRWIAPETFDDHGDYSRVYAQPSNPAQEKRALMAVLACPTASIGTESKHDLREAQAAFPDPIAGGVYHCGYHDAARFGAASWLVARARGNVLIDAPRFNKPLVRRLEELGGVKTIFLTHRDDVGDYRKFAAHFGASTIIHADDAEGGEDLLVSGVEPYVLDEQITLLPVPGHTRGSMCMIYDREFLFSGDHVAWSPYRKHVYAFRDACWYSWREQIASMKRLAEYRFEHILPGHGHRCHFPADEMRAQMARCIAWMTM